MRLYTVVLSVVLHAAIVVVLIIVPLYAMDALPGARRAIAFVPVSAAELPDVPPPPPRGGNPSSAQDVSPTAAPTVAPAHIAAEATPPSVGLPDEGPGYPGGMPDGVPVPDVPVVLPPPPPTTPLRQGGNIRPPQKTNHVAPVYPPLAQSARKEGVVILDAVIGEDGRVKDVRVLRSIPLLDQAAIDAVRQWRFTPTLLNGQAVPIVMTVTVAFQLK